MSASADSSPTTNVLAAGRVAKAVELVQIRLASMRFNTALDIDPPSEFRIKQFMTHRYQLEAEGASLVATLGYRLTLQTGDEDSRESETPSVEVEAFFQAFYRLKNSEGLSDSDFDCFAELNGTLNTYPYWRELVQSTTSRAGLGGITMPVWRAKTREVPSLPSSSE